MQQFLGFESKQLCILEFSDNSCHFRIISRLGPKDVDMLLLNQMINIRIYFTHKIKIKISNEGKHNLSLNGQQHRQCKVVNQLQMTS